MWGSPFPSGRVELLLNLTALRPWSGTLAHFLKLGSKVQAEVCERPVGTERLESWSAWEFWNGIEFRVPLIYLLGEAASVDCQSKVGSQLKHS